MSEAARYPNRLLPVSSCGRWEVKEFILPRVPFSCVAVPHEERCLVFRFASLHAFMSHDEDLVFSYSFLHIANFQ